MKGTPDCIPCLLRRTLCAARHLADDAWLHRKTLVEAMGYLQKADLDRAPAELVTEVSRLAGKVLGSQDPFAKVKEEHRHEARALEEGLRARIAASATPLEEATRLAARANLADAAVFGRVALGDGLSAAALERPLAVDDATRLAAAVAEAKAILYVCDNAGEVLVDRLLVEQLVALGKQVTCVVRRGPLANDATLEDAEWAGLPALASVVEAGAGGLGLPLALLPAEVRERYDAADLVIGKGSASFQSLDGEPKKKFFLMAVKCEVMGRHLGVPVGGVVVYGD